MLDITFEYQDRFTHGRWVSQSCRMPTVEDCIKCYGLGVDCQYRIISAIPVGETNSIPVAQYNQ